MRTMHLKLLTACIVAFSLGAISAYSQEKTHIGDADKIKAVLLRPGGWAVEYRGPIGDGVMEILFEARGENIVAKIDSPTVNMKCERETTIVSDVVKMDACYSTGITLIYDPKDNKYPFKGGNESVDYKLKPK